MTLIGARVRRSTSTAEFAQQPFRVVVCRGAKCGFVARHHVEDVEGGDQRRSNRRVALTQHARFFLEEREDLLFRLGRQRPPGPQDGRANELQSDLRETVVSLAAFYRDATSVYVKLPRGPPTASMKRRYSEGDIV